MRAAHLVLACAALAVMTSVLAVILWVQVIAPPAPTTFDGTRATVSGRNLHVAITLGRQEPCVPISLQFIQADGRIARVPGVRVSTPAYVSYDVRVPDIIPAGEAVFWTREEYPCGSYRVVETPRVKFRIEK